jgi:hypothetical protein
VPITPEAVQVTASTADPAAVIWDHAATPLLCASVFTTRPEGLPTPVEIATGACQAPDGERSASIIEPLESQVAEALLFAPIEAERPLTVVMNLLVTEKMVV